MKKRLKGIISIVVLILFVIFLYPKPSGYDGQYTSRDIYKLTGDTWIDKKCFCLGYEYEHISFQKMDLCMGIPFSCKCFENSVNNLDEVITNEVECKW